MFRFSIFNIRNISSCTNSFLTWRENIFPLVKFIKLGYNLLGSKAVVGRKRQMELYVLEKQPFKRRAIHQRWRWWFCCVVTPTSPAKFLQKKSLMVEHYTGNLPVSYFLNTFIPRLSKGNLKDWSIAQYFSRINAEEISVTVNAHWQKLLNEKTFILSII